MKIKVHWIIDGIIEVEAESAEDAEKIVDDNLKKYIDANDKAQAIKLALSIIPENMENLIK